MRLKIYYLDDEALLLEIFSDLFATAEIEVTTFSDPLEAVKAVRESPPDLIFLDYRLPGTTGVEVADQMDPSLPKALVTGDLEAESGQRFMGKFHKPYVVSEIRKFLDSFLSAKKKVA